MFQCSQSSRGWWNVLLLLSAGRRSGVSVLSVEPWLVELAGRVHKQHASAVSVLSVEPWLVEQCKNSPMRCFIKVSVLSVEPWLVELGVPFEHTWSCYKFQCSQSSRGWWNSSRSSTKIATTPFQCSQSSRGWWNSSGTPKMAATSSRFSALSRAVVGGTPVTDSIGVIDGRFQCSQSSRGWWNSVFVFAGVLEFDVSVLSVEPWLVEPRPASAAADYARSFSALSRAVVGGTMLVPTSLNVARRFSALSRAVVGGTLRCDSSAWSRCWFQCSQSSRGWWNRRS